MIYFRMCGFSLMVFILLRFYTPEICANEITVQNDGKKYNVVLIAINVLRANHLSCYGYHKKTSPAIDEVAKDSFVFMKAFAQAGYTLPNMMSIITSLYPDSHGVFDVYKDKLSKSVKTIAQILQIYGYKTAWFSVLGEPHLSMKVGFERGYDDFGDHLDETYRGKKNLLSWIAENKDEQFFLAMNIRSTHSPYFPLPKYKNAFKEGEKGSIIENDDEFFKAIYFKILESIDNPLIPMYGLFDKETANRIKSDDFYPYNGIEKWQKRVHKISKLIPPNQLYKLGRTEMMAYEASIDISNKNNLKYLISLYDSCILSVDQEFVEPIMSAFKKYGIYDNTIIIITADHGESLGEHQRLGHGFQFYDEVIYIPLIVRVPFLKDSRKIEALVQSIDIMPTILSLIGAEKPYNLQGKSLVSLMKNKKDTPIHTHIYGENRNFAYLRSDEWKLIAVRKFLEKESFHDNDKLYKLQDDPKELVNQNDEQQEVYQKLRNKIKNHLREKPKYIEKEYEFAPNIDKAAQERIKKTGYW